MEKFRRLRAVFLSAFHGDFQKRYVQRYLQVFQCPGPDSERIGHEKHVLYTHGFQARKHTPDDIHLLMVIKNRTKSHAYDGYIFQRMDLL